jgi:hypothetical protein
MIFNEVGMPKRKIFSIILFGILGAYAGIILGDICIWSLSVSPEFTLMSFLTYLNLVPFGIGIAASLVSIGLAYKYKGLHGKVHAFYFALMSTFLSIWITPVMIFVLISGPVNLNQRRDNLSIILVGIIFVVVLAMFRLLAVRKFGTLKIK